MDRLHLPLPLPLPLPLRTPTRRLRAVPVLSVEGNESSSSSLMSMDLDSFALAPRRNYEQELETRTLYMCTMDHMTSKKLELPSLTGLDNQQSMTKEGRIPTLSLKRKRRCHDRDIIIEPPRSFKKLEAARSLFRPIVSSDEESIEESR